MRIIFISTIVILAGISFLAGCSEDGNPLAPEDPGDSTPWHKIDQCSSERPYVVEAQWSNLSPVFRLGSSLPSSWRLAAEYAAAEWNSSGSNLEIKINRTITSRSNHQDGYNVISYKSLSGNQLGVCYVWRSSQTGRIIEADIVLNSNKPLSLGGANNTFDVQSILTHEFGHFCGLWHVSDRTHTMYTNMPPECTIYRTLCGGDKRGMIETYGRR